MSSSSRPFGPGGRRPSAAGFSLVEVLIATVLLISLLYAVTTLSASGTQAADFSRRLTRASEVTQEIVDTMRVELTSSVRLFGNDVEGLECLQRFDLVGTPVPVGGLRMPTFLPNGTVRVDTAGNEVTGNVLFYAKGAWTDRFTCTSGNEYFVDIVRWVLYYLTPEAGGPQPGRPTGLNLVRVVSEPIVDASTIDPITDPADEAEVLLHLVNATPDSLGETHDPVEIVWMRGELPSVPGTFRQIDPNSGLLSSTPLGGRASPFEVERATATVRGLLYYRHHSVATNYSQPSFGVGSFGILDNTNGGFPHGFEVQIAGPSSARQVLIHLVVVSTNRSGHIAWSDSQVVVDARDL